MLRTVSSMLFQAALLLLVIQTTSVTESQSRHADSQRLVRMETETPGSSISRVELTADGKTRWETELQVTKEIEDQIPADDEIVKTYTHHKDAAGKDDTVLVSVPSVVGMNRDTDMKVSNGVITQPSPHDILETYAKKAEDESESAATASEHDGIEDRIKHFSHGSGIHYTYPQRKEKAKALPVLPASDDVLMAFQVQGGSETQADGPRQALLGHPAGPCLWLLEIGRAEKGSKPVVWRTVMVNGTKDDNFYFRGCTTYGEDAALCHAGVSIMRNMRGQVVEVGSCCKTSLVDSIVTSRIQHCGKPQPTVVVKAPELQANSSSWWSSVYEAARDSPLAWRMDTGSPRLVLEAGLFAVACLTVMLAYCLMYKRYKK